MSDTQPTTNTDPAPTPRAENHQQRQQRIERAELWATLTTQLGRIEQCAKDPAGFSANPDNHRFIRALAGACIAECQWQALMGETLLVRSIIPDNDERTWVVGAFAIDPHRLPSAYIHNITDLDLIQDFQENERAASEVAWVVRRPTNYRKPERYQPRRQQVVLASDVRGRAGGTARPA